MKYLKIDDNKACYLKMQDNSPTWVDIDKINRNDLMTLLNNAIDGDFEMDNFDADKLGNKAHQLIYKNIHEKFSNLLANKDQFKDASGKIYQEAMEKYTGQGK